MNAELVPTVFGTAMTPTGQRGIYAHWRNTAGVTTQLAFKTLKRQ
jgi:predicted phage gp36 major capsid-like protein